MKAQTVLKPIKICIDVAMTVIFLLLMGYHLLDGATHEWLGASLFVLFITHNALNYKWYLVLFKGKYGAIRMIQTAINFLLLIAMIGCSVSAVCISGHAFAWMNASPASFGRELHLLSTVWAFILMALHFGFHWSFFVGRATKIVKLSHTISLILRWVFRVIVLAICVYGCYNLIVRKPWEEMFLLTEFKWFDYEKSLFLYFLESLSIMISITSISYYLRKIILLVSKIRRENQSAKENNCEIDKGE